MNATRNTTCLLMACALAASVAWATIPASAATGAAGIPLLGATAHVGRFLIYALRNSEKNPHDREDHFGIVHADFSPKPAFNALKNRNR